MNSFIEYSVLIQNLYLIKHFYIELIWLIFLGSPEENEVDKLEQEFEENFELDEDEGNIRFNL